jgi:surface antigen
MFMATFLQRERRVRFCRQSFFESYISAAEPASLRLPTLGLAIGAALSVSGCSAVIPLPSLISRDDTTGSIAAPLSPLSSSLDVEDWRRARAAMAVALDPQGNGAVVNWENPKSGAKGAFTPVGDARPADDRICRAFIAEIGGATPAQTLQGVACRDKASEWSVNDVKPWKKG